jgi:hypothetical protein
MMRYPTPDSVRTGFTELQWPRVIANKEAAISNECIRLMDLDGAYNYQGLASAIILRQISAICAMSANHTEGMEAGNRTASELFVAQNGSATIYQALLYFATYSTDYKSTYQAYDVSDILRQYKAKFEPYLRARIKTPEERKQTMPKEWITGRRALEEYLRSETSKGYDLTRCTLVDEDGNVLAERVIPDADGTVTYAGQRYPAYYIRPCALIEMGIVGKEEYLELVKGVMDGTEF